MLFQTSKLTKKFQEQAKYKIQRNKVVMLLRQSKGRFFSNLDSANTKEFWKAVKQLNNNKNTTIPTLSDGQSSVSSNIGKADLFNKYFLRRIGASNQNVGKISFLCSCLQRELHD